MIDRHKLICSFSCLFFSGILMSEITAQYLPVEHRIPAGREIPVSTAGNYEEEGATYILVNDISDPKSAFFLGKDVTLDLNGYTITYAAGNYDHIPNGSFEEGLKGWDISNAPSQRLRIQKYMCLSGITFFDCRREEIVSDLLTSRSSRSYFAFCGVIGMDMKVSVFVEDSKPDKVYNVLWRHPDAQLSHLKQISQAGRRLCLCSSQRPARWKIQDQDKGGN